jgi:hypothetical protein
MHRAQFAEVDALFSVITSHLGFAPADHIHQRARLMRQHVVLSFDRGWTASYFSQLKK